MNVYGFFKFSSLGGISQYDTLQEVMGITSSLYMHSKQGKQFSTTSKHSKQGNQAIFNNDQSNQWDRGQIGNLN